MNKIKIAKEALMCALHGKPIDALGNRDDDGMNGHFNNSTMHKSKVEEALNALQSLEGAKEGFPCVICNVSGTDDGLCDAHKYDEQKEEFKELLKQAGDSIYYDYDIYSEVLMVDKIVERIDHWNPIESNGHAFKLMIDGKIELCLESDHVLAARVGTKEPLVCEKYADNNGDKLASARLAIVKAACK